MPDERASSAGKGGQERKPHPPEEEPRRERTRRERDGAGLQQENERLRRENERLKQQIDHLEKQLAAARRAGRRQAAPFAKDRPQGRGGRPGRRAGAAYGRQACRPRPAQVDEHDSASAPATCPDCGGAVAVSRVATQYQEDLPVVRPIVRRFDIEVGHCSQCRRRVPGRHALQTSDALGAASVQLGPEVVALVVELHTHLGVPLAKVAHLLRTRFGLTVTPGGLAQVLHRAARDAAPTYTALCKQIREAPVVTPDETGWRVGAVRHWLWVFATPDTTVYAICPGRGFDDAEEYDLPTAAPFGRPQTSCDSIEADLESLRFTVRRWPSTAVTGTDRETAVSDLLLQFPLVARRQHRQPLGRAGRALTRGVPITLISQGGDAAIRRWKRPPNPVWISDSAGCGADCAGMEQSGASLREGGDRYTLVHGDQERTRTTLRHEIPGVDHQRACAIATLAQRLVGPRKVRAVMGDQKADDILGGEQRRSATLGGQLIQYADPFPEQPRPRAGADTGQITGEGQVLAGE